MDNLKIALFYNLPSGGAKRTIYEWLRRASDWAVDVYTLSTADHAFLDLRPYVRQYNVFEFSPHRLFNSPFGRLNQGQRWRDLLSLQKTYREIAGKINQGGYDLAFIQPCLFTYIPELVKYLKIPSVYYLHEPLETTEWKNFSRPYMGTNDSYRSRLNQFDPLIKLYHSRLRQLQSDGINSVSRVLANSRYTQQQTFKTFGIEADICYLGVDTDRFKPSPQATKEYAVISVGELSPRKGFDFLVEGLSFVPADKRPVLKLVCNRIDEDERTYIENLAREKGVRLAIRERLDTDELARAYNSSLMCVYTPVQEPFGLVPLEAMSCGLPVVGINEGGVPETVIPGLTGLLVERDPKELAKAIWSLLDNSAFIDTFGKKARAQVQEYWTWEQSLKRLKTNFEKLIRRKINSENSDEKLIFYQ